MQPRDGRPSATDIEALVTTPKKKPAKRPAAKAKSVKARTSRRRTSVAPPVVTRATTVVEALERDLAALCELPKGSEALIASAFALARELDAKNSATSKSMCARAFREQMEQLRALAPTEPRKDAIDELAARRSQRRSRTTKAAAK